MIYITTKTSQRRQKDAAKTIVKSKTLEVSQRGLVAKKGKGHNTFLHC
jgi:hypothetical protein